MKALDPETLAAVLEKVDRAIAKAKKLAAYEYGSESAPGQIWVVSYPDTSRPDVVALTRLRRSLASLRKQTT